MYTHTFISASQNIFPELPSGLALLMQCVVEVHTYITTLHLHDVRSTKAVVWWIGSEL